MEDSENKEVNRFEKEQNKDRQRNMTARRKDSGWKGYRLQLSKSDYSKIQKLGKKLKYDIPDERASLIDISTIVSYSLSVACRHEGLRDRDLPKASQDRLYRHRVKEVIRHRLRQERRKSDQVKLVAEFMQETGYDLPAVSEKTKKKIPKNQQNSWCEAWIAALVPNQL